MIRLTHLHIFDVEVGEAMRGTAPKDAKTAISRLSNRRGLTATEGVALALHNGLTQIFVDCVGSRYHSGVVPNVCLGDGEPRLYWSYSGDGDSEWGAAFCRSV